MIGSMGPVVIPPHCLLAFRTSEALMHSCSQAGVADSKKISSHVERGVI